ncbi:MAG: universal stress protein [Rhodospirillales bacterium]|nr:universal stress protein [Rhodospirillales bacterium]
MAIRKILVAVDGSPGGRIAVDAALITARAFGAHVEGLHVRPDPRDAVPLLGEGVSGAMVDELIVLTEQETQARAKIARAMFDELCHTHGLRIADRPAAGPSGAWVEATGRTDDMVVARARLADLVVVERPLAEMEAVAGMTLNAALYEGGRPVLVPAGTPSPQIGRNVAVAWNGSAESARAVSGALSFLKAAETVTVLTAGSAATSPDRAEDLVDYLAWHEIDARRGAVTSEDGPVGARILEACRSAGADLLVIGAYTHSRLRELIMGGVTRHVLANARIPLLMAH